MKVHIYNQSRNNLPEYSTIDDAGCDIRLDLSRIKTMEDLKYYGDVAPIIDEDGMVIALRMFPLSRVLCPTGIYTTIPQGWHIEVRPRSGLALKKGLTVLNSPGTIDSSYKNEYGVILQNLGVDTVEIEDGERIAQLVLMPVEHIDWVEVDSKEDLPGNDRGGGFGHTGIN